MVWILAFAARATSITILGFEKQGTLTFLHGGGTFPTASTCDLAICLHIHEDYKVFKAKMLLGILNAHGFFGNVYNQLYTCNSLHSQINLYRYRFRTADILHNIIHALHTCTHASACCIQLYTGRIVLLWVTVDYT